MIQNRRIDYTLRQIRYVLSIYELQNFTKAARANNISQPALSAQLLELEKMLNIQIFERAPNRLIVTAPGKEIIEHFKKIQREMDELDNKISLVTSGKLLSLNFGIIPTMAPYLVPRILKDIKLKHKSIKLILREEQTDYLVDKLLEGKLEFCLVALPILKTGVSEKFIAKDPFFAIANKSHELVTKNICSIADLTQDKLILLEDGHCLRDQALEVCKLDSKSYVREIQATSMNTLVQMVSEGLGISLIPLSSIQVELRNTPDIKLIPLKDNNANRSIGLIWRKNSSYNEPLLKLVETVSVAVEFQLKQSLKFVNKLLKTN